MRFAGSSSAIQSLFGGMDSPKYGQMEQVGQKARGMERNMATESDAQARMADIQGDATIQMGKYAAEATKAQGEAAGQSSMASGISSGLGKLFGGMNFGSAAAPATTSLGSYGPSNFNLGANYFS